MEEYVTSLLAAHIETSLTLADQLPQSIVQAGLKITESLLDDGKILLCARGRSFANGLHFVTAMLNRYEVDRPPLPIVMLGGYVSILQQALMDGNDDQIFAREVQALGQPKDVLLILMLTGESAHWAHVIYAAKEKRMRCIVVCVQEEEGLSEQLDPSDIEVCLPAASSSRLIEMQLLVLHGFCEVVDHALFAQIME